MPARARKDWWVEERTARGRGFRVIGGIDEAGRGPLAGPVVAACVVLPFEEEMAGVRDSKTLTSEQRDAAYLLVRERALGVGVGIVDPPMIDTMNILRATHHAMRLAVNGLPFPPDFVLIDGLPVHPFPITQQALVKGDGRSASIAAASIIAKVTRDRLMLDYDRLYPEYGFAEHKGYPTPAHMALVERLGPCPIHRRSFGPVTRALEAAESTGPGGQRALDLDPPARQETGIAGEAIAAAHLRSQGYEVLKTRFRAEGGEIDIVARDGDTFVFVEVKTRHGRGDVLENVSARKRECLVTAAAAWLAQHGCSDVACRFDVAEVSFDGRGLASVALLRAAFIAGE